MDYTVPQLSTPDKTGKVDIDVRSSVRESKSSVVVYDITPTGNIPANALSQHDYCNYYFYQKAEIENENKWRALDP